MDIDPLLLSFFKVAFASGLAARSCHHVRVVDFNVIADMCLHGKQVRVVDGSWALKPQQVSRTPLPQFVDQDLRFL